MRTRPLSSSTFTSRIPNGDSAQPETVIAPWISSFVFGW